MSLSVMYSYLRSCNTPSNGTPVSLTTSAKILQKKRHGYHGGEEQEGVGDDRFKRRQWQREVTVDNYCAHKYVILKRSAMGFKSRSPDQFWFCAFHDAGIHSGHGYCNRTRHIPLVPAIHCWLSGVDMWTMHSSHYDSPRRWTSSWVTWAAQKLPGMFL